MPQGGGHRCMHLLAELALSAIIELVAAWRAVQVGGRAR